MPSWHVEPAQSLPDFTTLVLKNAWKNCSKPGATYAGADILPNWLQNRRWFAGKDAAIEQVHLAYGVRFGDASTRCCSVKSKSPAGADQPLPTAVRVYPKTRSGRRCRSNWHCHGFDVGRQVG
jgi:hypothetical protein